MESKLDWLSQKNHINIESLVLDLTRPDTRHDSRGQLGRGHYAKTTRNSKIIVTDQPTDQHGKVYTVESRVPD